MRKSDLKKNHVPFDSALIRYRSFMKKVVDAQRVIGTAEEKQDLAESVVLRLCAVWEQFVDEHIVDCVNCDPSKLGARFGVSLPTNPSKGLCQALIIGDRYLDFRSFSDLLGFCKRVLPDGSNPFDAISKTHRKRMDEVYAIRNYLSHYSARARRQLHEMYKREYKMDRFVQPGRFLLAYRARRLWGYLDAFTGASSDMKSWY
jgi:hypothetical protein